MPTKIMIAIEDEERAALYELAKRERRDPRDQVALILRAELVDLGLLPIEHQQTRPRRPVTPQKVRLIES